MNHIEVTLELLTPAFLSGADQNQVELRAPSIKGLLRWWWRAAVGHQFRSVAELAEAEGRLFGSATMKLKSPLHLSAELLPETVAEIPRGTDAPTSSAQYEFRRRDREGSVHTGRAQALHYLGYGPMRLPSREERERAEAGHDPAPLGQDRRAKKGVVFIRRALAPGTRFALKMSWREGTLSARQQDQVIRALGAWVALGGVGCRSRKGFGSLWLMEPVRASSPELTERATTLLRRAQEEFAKSGDRLPTVLPKWPQVRFWQVLHRTPAKTSWEEALGALAVEYRKLRPRLRDRERRFICGEVNPRRASSVFLSVHRDGNGFSGIMVAMPCWKDPQSEARQAWKSFLEAGR